MEKRQEARRRAMLGAKIIFNDGQSVFDCELKDISPSGAHLKMASTLGVPHIFTLFVPQTGRKEQCWLVWSDMKELGVSFSPGKYERRSKSQFRLA
jgi:hypothetical protein